MILCKKIRHLETILEAPLYFIPTQSSHLLVLRLPSRQLKTSDLSSISTIGDPWGCAHPTPPYHRPCLCSSPQHQYGSSYELISAIILCRGILLLWKVTQSQVLLHQEQKVSANKISTKILSDKFLKIRTVDFRILKMYCIPNIIFYNHSIYPKTCNVLEKRLTCKKRLVPIGPFLIVLSLYKRKIRFRLSIPEGNTEA